MSLVTSGAVLQTLKIYVTRGLWMETSVRLLNCVYLLLLLLVLIIVSIVFSNVRGMAWTAVTALKKPCYTKYLYIILSYSMQKQGSSFNFFSDAAPDFSESLPWRLCIYFRSWSMVGVVFFIVGRWVCVKQLYKNT